MNDKRIVYAIAIGVLLCGIGAMLGAFVTSKLCSSQMDELKTANAALREQLVDVSDERDAAKEDLEKAMKNNLELRRLIGPKAPL